MMQFTNGVNAIKNGQKEMDDTLAVQPQYWQPVNAT
jgi:hypothetical protein